MSDTVIKALVAAVVALVLVMLLRPKSDLDGKRARELVKKGEQLVDVRSAAEHAAGHIDGAVNIPVGAIAARAGELSKDEPVILYCQSGARSAAAKGALQRAGFTEVYNLGGMSNW